MIKKILALCLAICMSIALLPAAAMAESDAVFVEQTTRATPSITTQPKNKTVALGETATFKVVASGAKAYQWEYSKDNGASWTTFTGKTSASLSVTASKTNNGCLYRCIVKNGTTSVTSSKARLTVSNVKPMILTNPSDKSTNMGNEVTFRAYAGGKNVSYQWEYSKDGGSSWKTWSGKTEKDLVVKASSTNNGCLYRCKASNSYGSVRTTAAKLTVKGVLSITKQPAAQKGAVGTTVSFKVEATGSNITYQWQYSKDKGKTWTNCSSTGYNKATFSFKTSRAMDQRMFRCIVTSNGASITSDAAKLTVPQYFAIVVGESDYPGTSDDRMGCKNDMDAFAGMISGLRAKYSVNKLSNVSKSDILNAINSYAKNSKSYDILVFFYSGHGVDASNYIQYNDIYNEYQGAISTVTDEYLTMSELAEALSAFKGKVFVMMNSCHSGAAINTRSLNEVVEEDPEELKKFNASVIDAFKGYTFEDETGTDEDGFPTRMGNLRTNKFTVMTAARYDQTASMLSLTNGLEFGVFSRGIVEKMACDYPSGTYNKSKLVDGKMPADTNGNSRVTLGELVTAVESYIDYWRWEYYNALGRDDITQELQYYGNWDEVLFRR